MNQELVEKVADVQHEIWSHWMDYLFSVSVLNNDGSVTITKENAKRWARQAITPYSELSRKEQESDIHQVEKILKVVDFMTQSDKEDLDHYYDLIERGVDNWEHY